MASPNLTRLDRKEATTVSGELLHEKPQCEQIPVRRLMLPYNGLAGQPSAEPVGCSGVLGGRVSKGILQNPVKIRFLKYEPIELNSNRVYLDKPVGD